MHATAPKVILPEKHVSFEALPELLEVCRHFFMQSKLQHFYYACFDLNKEEISIVTTLPDFNKYAFATGNVPVGPELETGVRYLPASQHSLNRVELGRRFNIANALEIVHNDGFGKIELFGFGTKVGQVDTVNYYLNNLSALQQFGLEFKDQAKDLINFVAKSPILIPGHNRLIKEPAMVRRSARSKNDLNINVNLSKRETDVLSMLYQGLSAKATAQRLNLSPRTVEHYLENLKNKLGLTRKSELLRFYIERGSRVSLM